MIYDQSYVSMHIKSNSTAVFSFQVVLSKTTHVDNTLGKSRNLFDTCGDVTPFCLLIFRSDTPLLKSDYRK